MDSGIVLDGVVQPGTEWVRRDSSAWWPAGDVGTKRRRGPTNLLVGHWTAGPAREGDTAAKRVVGAMKARTKPDGRRLNVGIHFVISWDGLVFQTSDLANATIHVSDGSINARSVGVETCSPGARDMARRLGFQVGTVKRTIAGRFVEAVEPAPEMLAAWVRLADTLAEILPIPRRVPAFTPRSLLAARFTPTQRDQWTGAMEHLHVPGTLKVDAATLLMGALVDAGWSREVP